MSLDFKALRTTASMAEVLARYGMVNLRPNGRHLLTGACPLHHGDNPTAFRVDLRRGLWHCFSRCGGGNVLDLVARVENINIYQAALRLKEWQSTAPPAAAPDTGRPVTPPLPELPFRLPLAPHPYLTQQRRLRQETCDHFGVGWCGRGMLRDTIAISIHDHRGRLVAYAGRRLAVPSGEGKYRFPCGFQKNQVLFNAWRVPDDGDTLMVVEGFFDVFHLYQNGYPNAVALMGSSISQAQLEWILERRLPVSILRDGDAAGRKGPAALARLLDRARHPYRSLTLEPGRQPEHLTASCLRRMLAAPVSALSSL